MVLDSPAKPTGEKRMAFQALDWSAFQQIRQLLTERTRARFNKNALYASLGVPEFWHLNGKNWQILVLTDEGYIEQDHSPTFPMIQKADLYQFLETALGDEVSAEIGFRQWVRQQI